ncbi:MAG: hypothetical protein WBG86_17040 [Polyangiales bacterium]
MNWHPRGSFGPRASAILSRLRNHFLSVDPDACIAAARQVSRASSSLDTDQRHAAVIEHFARAAAKDGAISALLPAPLALFVDYRRTSKHVANLWATLRVLQHPDVDIRFMSSTQVRDVPFGTPVSGSSDDEAARDLTILGGFLLAKFVGVWGRTATTATLQLGPLQRWWLRPVGRSVAAGAWNYAELTLAGRVALHNLDEIARCDVVSIDGRRAKHERHDL